MSKQWDAIVVGARCAGSPTAMLLARRGYKVLLVDSARFPSDTVSTHLVHPPGVDALKRWGLLDRLAATGCPPIDSYAYDFGPVTISGPPGRDRADVAYCPRRTILDKLLLDAAAQAGAEIREGFTVDEITTHGGNVTGIRGRANASNVIEAARVVIGADGRHSRVVEAVRPEQYHDKPPVQVSYYTYFSDLPTHGFETYVRPYRAWAVMPTHADLTLVIAGRPIADFDEYRKDIEGNYFKTFDLVPDFAERIRKAKREARFAGASVAGYFRKPFGPGWALVGDAGYNKDFITAMGITDAFRDAELCANALHDAFSGARSFDAAMGAYQLARDEQVLPIYEFTYRMAPLAPPPPDFQELLGAISGNPEAMAGFVQVTSAVRSPVDFFSDANVQRIFAAARPRAAQRDSRGTSAG
jgi:2-polyprenyl-6-methoxyphenol hydroxylase-like FAD-dependent oxidoreductase